MGHDPKIRDAPLTNLGRDQAMRIGKSLCGIDYIECGMSESNELLVVVSPLTRAMETASLALDSSKCVHVRKVLNPDLREWRRALADIGT